MMDASWSYCNNPFTTYVNQAIALYALSSYSDVCQYKTGKKEL